MPPERLQKILSNAGLSSRRNAEELLLEGRITVNGRPATELGARADPDVDEILVDGVPVRRDQYRYFVLNKPIGVVTTASDERGRETVLDLVPIGDIVLHPVGRLDADSEGLLLITNDGHLTNLLTHPSYEVEKEYLAGIDLPVSRADQERLVRGVESEGQRLRAVSVQPAEPPEDDAILARPEASRPGAWLLITLREGKNREIRRMLSALGRKTMLLRRIRVGPLHLGTMGSGSFRELEPAEVDALYRAGTQAAKEAERRAAEEPPVREPKRGVVSGPARDERPERRGPEGGGFRPEAKAGVPRGPVRKAGPARVSGGPTGETLRGDAAPGRPGARGARVSAPGERPTRDGSGARPVQSPSTAPRGARPRPGAAGRDVRGAAGSRDDERPGPRQPRPAASGPRRDSESRSGVGGEVPRGARTRPPVRESRGAAPRNNDIPGAGAGRQTASRPFDAPPGRGPARSGGAPFRRNESGPPASGRSRPPAARGGAGRAAPGTRENPGGAPRRTGGAAPRADGPPGAVGRPGPGARKDAPGPGSRKGPTVPPRPDSGPRRKPAKPATPRPPGPGRAGAKKSGPKGDQRPPRG